jgi:hypothetical protein
MLFKGRREAFEAEGKEDLYDRFHKALEKEPDRNIDLIGEIYTPDEEKRIMRIFEKRGLKV